MTLNRRALLLIFPVVLVASIIAASMVYRAQSSSILRLEQARLSQQVSRLQAAFQKDVTFDKTFLYAILGGSAARLFIEEKDASYRGDALGTRLQESIKYLLDDPTQFASFAIVDRDQGINYYFENSNDPFAEMGRQQRDLVARLRHDREIVSWDLVNADDGTPLIVLSQFVLPETFTKPLPDQKPSAFLLQAAVRPGAFLSLRKSLEAEYGAALEIATAPLAENGELSQVAPIGPCFFLRLTPSPDYLAARLLPQKLTFGFGGLAMSLLSIGLMILLVRRYITMPIARLDTQLTDVMHQRRDAIEPSAEGGEIGRLTTNVKALYDSVLQAMRKVQETSWTDTLTGIGNRARFNAIAAGEIEAAAAAGDRLALLFIDLDNFKFVNDNYGHDSGDAVLQAFTHEVEAVLVERAVTNNEPPAAFFRLSGDEFAILSRSAPDSTAAQGIAMAIIDRFVHGVKAEDHAFPVTPSIGIAAYPDHATSLSQLISHADAAMYQAKAAGKNGFAFFSRSIEEKGERARQILERLRRLDPDEEFRLAYMPIVQATGAVVGCEALLRWASPELGDVLPGEFVAIAQSNGLFAKIDRWVIEHALADYRELERLFGAGLRLSVNVSSAELRTGLTTRYIQACLSRHGIAASLLEVELTEAAATGEHTRTNARALRNAGLRIAIDDFGAGSASIRQIVDYPANSVKLDGTLVERLIEGANFDVLKSIIALCHARGLSVTAEGVNTAEKVEVLRACGCDLLQGYEISAPLSLQDLAIWQLKRVGAAMQPAAGQTPGSARRERSRTRLEG